MKKMLVGVIVLVLVIIGGFFVYRSTEPNGGATLDLSPVSDTDSSGDSLPGGDDKFIQLAPDDALPVTADEEDDESTGIVTPPSVSSVGGDVVISMTDTGFTPSSVTIAAGDTVTFVNDGQAKHWPASVIHPTHQILPGFDNLGGLETGDVYSFRFTKAGNWNFHDHLNPNFLGTVTVK